MMPVKKSAPQGKGIRALPFPALLIRSLLLLLSFSLAIGLTRGLYLEDDIINCESLDQDSQSSAVWKVVKISEVRRFDKALDEMLLRQKLKSSQVYLEVLVSVENISDQKQTLTLPHPSQAIYLEQMSVKERFPVTEVISDSSRSVIERVKILGALDPNSKMREPVASKEELALSLIFIVPKKAADSDFLFVFVDASPQPLVSTSGTKQ